MCIGQYTCVYVITEVLCTVDFVVQQFTLTVVEEFLVDKG